MNAAGWALTAGCGAVAGLVTGVFLTVLLTRIPAGDPAFPAPGSCPRCAARRPAAGPVPQAAAPAPPASWLRARGRCGSCGAAWRTGYPAVVLATGTLFAVMALRFGFGPTLPAAWYLAAVGVALSAIDVRRHRLPDVLTLPSYPAAILLLGGGGLLLPGGRGHLQGALLGMLAAGAFFLLLAFLQPAGIGWGDVKLSGVVGFYLGWFGTAALLTGLFAAFALAAVTGLALITAGRATRKSQLPLGAFMLAAALAVIAGGGLLPSLA